MAIRSLSSELTLDEIEDLEHQLEGPRGRRLEDVQERIHHILKSDETELKKYKVLVNPRKGVKPKHSVVEKINDHRRAGETSYDIECVEDLIGAKMICPYADDLEKILDWLYSPEGGLQFFQILTTRSDAETEQRERERETGYRAYHICLKLNPDIVKAHQLSDKCQYDKFELQIKTSLEAAWDDLTHDVTYKPRDIEPGLGEHMKFISHGLTAVDRQTVLLRRQIQDEQISRRWLREGAIVLLLHDKLNDKHKEQLGIARKDFEQWQEEDIRALKDKLRQYRRNKDIGLTLTLGLALLALLNEDRYEQERALSRYEQEQALSSASYLVTLAENKKSEEELCSALRIRAMLRWAFHKTQYAVDDMRRVLESSDIDKDKNSFAYYVSELHKPNKDDLEKAWRYIRELEISSNFKDKGDQTKVNDTVGKFYIRFGNTIKEKRKGIEIVRHAEYAAQITYLGPLLRAFRAYHEYLFFKELAKCPKET